MSVVQHGQSTGVASGAISVTLPSAPTAGNMLVCVIDAAITGTITGPSGWTTRVAQTNFASSDNYAVFEILATGSTSQTVGANLSVNARYSMVVVEVAAASFDAIAIGTESNSPYSCPGITAAGSDTVLTVVCYESRGTTSFTWDNSFTALLTEETAHSTGNGAGISIATRDVTSGTSTGTTTGSASVTTAGIGFQIGYSAATPGVVTASSAGLSLAAPTGSVSAGVAVTAGTASLVLAAVAGLLGTPTTAGSANLALVAPAGTISIQGTTAAPANLALAAPAGTVLAGQSLTASPTNLNLAAPAGVVIPPTTAAPANLALAAPAGTVVGTGGPVTAAPAGLTLAAPAGTATSAFDVTADWGGLDIVVALAAQTVDGTITCDWGGLALHVTGQPYDHGATPPPVPAPSIGLCDEDGNWLRNLPLAAGIAFQREVSAPGSLSCKLPMDDAATAQATAKRILKVYWKGHARQAARIDSSSVQLAVDGRAWREFQALPGLSNLLAEMAVYPEYSPPLTTEIRALSTTRSIGYMSLPDSSHPDSGVWAAAQGAPWSDGFYRKHFLADALTDPDPWWISQQWPPPSLLGGAQQWFRRVFTTYKGAAYQILATADNAVTLYLDGEQIIDTDPQDRHGYHVLTQISGTLPAGKHVLAARVLNVRGGDFNPLSFLMTMQETDPNGDPYPGTPLINTNTRWQVSGTLPGFRGGQVLRILFDEAEARGVKAANLLARGWSDAKDSRGNAWTDTPGEYSFDTSSGLLDVAQQLAASRLDFDVEPHTLTLHAYNRLGADKSGTVVFDLGKDGGSIMSYQIDRVEQGANTALIQLSDGTWIERQDTAAVNAYGRAEVGLSMGSTSDAASARAAADAQFDELPSLTFTMQHSTLDGPQPFTDYGIGDTISVPNDTGTGHVKARVMAITVDASNDGPPVVTPELAWDQS